MEFILVFRNHFCEICCIVIIILLVYIGFFKEHLTMTDLMYNANDLKDQRGVSPADRYLNNLL